MATTDATPQDRKDVAEAVAIAVLSAALTHLFTVAIDEVKRAMARRRRAAEKRRKRDA